jgi:hypothetical protein
MRGSIEKDMPVTADWHAQRANRQAVPEILSVIGELRNQTRLYSATPKFHVAT